MTGIELIAKERHDQIFKHGRDIVHDVKFNSLGQLSVAAGILSQKNIPDYLILIPKGWDVEIWNKMLRKPYEQRLIIAGALISAEIERLHAVNQLSPLADNAIMLTEALRDKTIYSLEGCPFHYCDKKPVCEKKCRYNN